MHTYDAAKHLFSFAGQLIANGFGPDTWLKVSRNNDGFTLTKGASGEGTRSKTNDNSGTVELTLMADSQANDILAAIGVADELSGTGVGALFIKEFNGTTRVSAGSAWIKKLPDLERAKEVGTVTWVFECDDLELFAGGLL